MRAISSAVAHRFGRRGRPVKAGQRAGERAPFAASPWRAPTGPKRPGKAATPPSPAPAASWPSGPSPLTSCQATPMASRTSSSTIAGRARPGESARAPSATKPKRTAAASTQPSPPTAASWPSRRSPRTWPSDTNGVADIYVFNRQTGTRRRVSLRSNGNQSNGFSADPSISANGRFVAFQSGAANLVAGDTNDVVDVFVHDRSTGKTRRVSVRSNGNQANAKQQQTPPSPPTAASWPSSPTPRTWWPATPTAAKDVFVHDRTTGNTRRVSVRSDGNAGERAQPRPRHLRRRPLRGLRYSSPRTWWPATPTGWSTSSYVVRCGSASRHRLELATWG